MPGRLGEVIICPTYYLPGYAWNMATSVGPQFRREVGKLERARSSKLKNRARGRG